jgi:D-alanyl-lipoteichoic acid acyltransferase DltB (MBOAT superfamily)
MSLRRHAPVGAATAATVAAWVLPLGFVRFAREYAAQSGVASIQIGCMRMLGYRIPERYRWPIFARSPADFWRRWNTYVGGWARTYVFFPLGLAIAKHRRRGTAKLFVVGGAILGTFGVVGVLHDAFLLETQWTFRTVSTRWFLLMGATVVAWEALGQMRRTASEPRWRPPLERCFFLIVLCTAAAFAP